MGIAKARNGEVEVAYETFGAPGGEPLMLMMGLDFQMVWWPEEFCAALADRGFQVVRFDNRDAGLSTHFDSPRVENGWKALFVRRRSAPPYTATDMVGDALAVMDDLGWESAHLFGLSMGAGLAQLTALSHPDRVRTLTSGSSVPIGNPLRFLPHIRFGPPLKMAFKRYRDGREGQVQLLIDIARMTESPDHPSDEEWLRRTAEEAYDRRPPDPTARQRQLAAARATKVPKPGLEGIRVPTLVIHGEADPLIRPSGGRAVARMIPDARLVTYPGMGHSLPRELWQEVVEEIATGAGVGLG